MSESRSDFNYPKRWADMSLDYRFFFVFFAGMMALFIAGASLSSGFKLIAASIAAILLFIFSIINRVRSGWRWRGVGWTGVLGALFSLLLGGAMAFAASPLASPLQTEMLPWYLCLGAISLFNALAALRLVRPSRADFAADCSATSAPPVSTGPALPAWKARVRAVYNTIFLAVWFEFLAFFYFSARAFHDGARQQTATMTAPMTDHGAVVFVAPATKALVDRLEVVGMIGIPTLIVSGFFLQFVARIPLLSGMPSRGLRQ